MGSLRFPVVLLVLLYTITEEAIQMGMLPEAADYLFQNCQKEMLQMVTKSGGLVQTELNNNPDFKMITWLHCIAMQKLVLNFMEDSRSWFRLAWAFQLNRDEFPFKSLFFLLTDAMQLIGKNHCRTGKEYNTKIGEKVRFESFFSNTSLSDNIGTVFNITSCSMIRFEDYGCISEEIDLLISPTEVFTATGIKTVSNSNDNFKEITLTHSHFQSSSNCSDLVSFPSSSLLNLMASILMLYYTLTL
uniref:NAD(P)(+)--arginine ADP-ribosyltransferase n=1 Tax=Sinocyclocheilus anshuiensis TaxID=1608454 RepID=A0A671K2E0_9TELE